MDSNQIKALRKDANDKLLDLTAITYKDGKEQSNWIEFLKSGMFTYKYPFSEQLQIHAQTQARDIKPRAVADLKIWEMFGYMLKPLDIEFYGEPENAPPTRKPIEILDNKNKLKQVYDISQMERRDGKDNEIPFKLWDKNLTPDKADNLKAALIEKYGLKYDTVNEASLSTVLFFCLEEKFKHVLDENQNKFAVGENISKRTYEEIGFTAFVSAQIMIMARLGSKAGINNDEVLSFYKMIHDKLPMINTKGTLTALGELTSAFAKEMFTEIEIIVKKQERELKIAREGFSHEQTRLQSRAVRAANDQPGLDNVGQNAAGISERVQPRVVSEVDGEGVTDNPLHGNTEANAGVHQEHDESDTSVPDRNGANARQSVEPIGVDTGNEQHTADGEGNSHQGTDRRQPVSEEKTSITPNTANSVVIGNILGFDPNMYGKPWICTVSRGKNYFATKEGAPIGGFTGNATDGTGGDVYIINPQEGRIYGYGHKNKGDNSKSLTIYVKYQDGGFRPCDRNGNFLEVNADIEENIEPESMEPDSKEPENKFDAERESEQTPETAPPINEPLPSTEDAVLAPETQNHTEPRVEAELPLKTEWEKYIEKGKYSDTHFHIRKNGYDSSGRSDWEESTLIAYENEVKKILTDNGWSVQQGIGSGRAATATKGKNYLYLHPQDFSGVCENTEREILNKAFNNANTFECETVDVYREIHNMTDEELNDKLNSEREAIEIELLEAFTTKRSNLYITSVGFFGVDGSIGKRRSVKRLAIEGKQSYHGVDDRTEGICATFANEVFKSLVDNGKIVSSKTKNGIGYRKANKDELNQIQLSDFTFQEQEVKQESLLENNEEAIDETAQGSPKWQEYQALAKEHADKILFVQVGDFYEVFGDNAVVAAKALNINSIGRDVGLPERVPMCGVPNFRLDEYTALLNQSGNSVAVKNNDGTINIYANEVAERSEPYTQTEDIDEQKKYNLDIFPMGGNGIIVYNRLETDISKYEKGHVLLSDIENDIGIIAHIHHERYIDWHSENIPDDIKNKIEEIARVSDNERLAKKYNNPSDFRKDDIEEPPLTTTPELPQNYRLNEQLLNRTSFGEKSRFKDNIQAIKTLKLIETENRTATTDEQEILSKYAGWGGISQAFNKDNPSWNAEYAVLKEVLTEQEYREAQSSTLSAFYTNPTVIKAMYETLENIGITAQFNENEKLNILEPALGVGNFFGMMPDELRGKANLHGIELDSISARIAQNLYPQANIQNTGYEETYAKDYFDVVIGNVPFGDFKLIDKQNPEISQQNFRIHDHFFGKALDQVKPGGVVAFITSSGTMDKETTKTRRFIAERAELLGAVRLPNNAFKGIANTEVTSDIIFLQRRAEPLNLTKIKEQAEHESKDGEEAIKQICPWIFTSKVSGINKINGEDVPINSYFINNPQMVLGEMTVDNGNRMHGALIPTCKPFDGMELSEQLETAMSDIKTAESITTTIQGYIGTFDVYEGLKTQAQEDIPIINTIPRNFSYVLGNNGSSSEGKIFFYEMQGKPLEDVTETFTDLQRERMTGLIAIKDTCRTLIEAQLNNHPYEIIKGLQAELNERYDTYASKHGLINGRVAKQLFAEDSSYPLLCALEVLDTDGEFVSKSEMFFKRTINPVIEITHADTAEEALILSMSERGAVDVAYMEKLTGRTENDLFSELVGLGKVYKDLRYPGRMGDQDAERPTSPIGENNYEYRTAQEFLSGNVRAKLSKAESLLGELEELRRKENLTPEEQLKNRQIQHLTEVFDVDEKLLKMFVESDFTERNINEFGRFNELMASVDRRKAKIFFEKTKGENIQPFRINMMADALFRDFVLNGKLDLKLDDTAHDIETAENSEAKAQRYAEILANIETLKYNITALEKSVPKLLESSDIDVRFGSTWIPPHYIGDFISEKLNLSDYAREGLGITYDKRTSTWGKNQKYTHVDSVLSTEIYGTKRIDAIDIMIDSLNLKDVKIYDPHPDDSKRKVLNYKETVLAQNVQKKIKKEFLDWIWDNSERRADLAEIYNRQFNAITPREYDGSNLRFTGMSPEVKLKPHQKNAVARILYGGNTLLAHEVGLGKTYEMIAAAMESKRLGLCNKSLITVPKHLTEQFGSDFLKVYPNANVLIVRENDFTPQNRKKFCAKIATGNYDAIIIAHSQFEKIPLSKERQENFIQDQLDELEYERDAEDSKSNGERNNFTIKQLEKRKKQLEAKLDELVNQEYKDDTIDFEELGIDRLFVDEAHFMKNLYFPTKLTGVAGLSKSESNRATDMFMKVRYLDEITGNKGTIFATGTPVSNSLSEMYVMQRFLQYDTLEEHGIYSFDDWASSFGDIVTSYEIAPEGNGKYRERRRFAEFFNLPELMNIFTQVADIKTSDTVDIPRPIAHRHTVVAQPDEITKQYIQTLSDRAEAVQQKRVKPEEDNMLAITNDGRKIGLDPRLMNNLLPDNPTSKLNTCVQNVFDIWNDTKKEKLTQLLFSDLSTPKMGKNAGFSAYDDIREKLVAKGIPREEIKFIHEAKNDAQKKALFEKVRNGEVRILLGSTEKMGSGTNVQNKLVALHNLDCPWRPSDLEQRIGRILRQGNDNKEIHIYNYVTENTFDAYLYQTIENKQKFISQIMTSKEIARRFSDIDETVLNYAEIKALCTGNPLIKDKLDLEREIGNLEIMRKSHTIQRHRLEDMVNQKGPTQLTNYRSRAEDIKNDLEALKQHPYNKDDKDNLPAFTIDGLVYTDRKEAGLALITACQKNTKEILSSKIGSYRGFEIHARYSFTNSNFELTLKRNHSYTISTGNSTDGNLTRINNALSEVSLIEVLEKYETNIKNLEQEIETAKEQLQCNFPQEDEYQAKLTRLEEINKELGIGLDKELEEAEKSEAEKSQASEVEAGQKSEAKVFEVFTPSAKTDDGAEMDAADGYDEFDEDEFLEDDSIEAENSRPQMPHPEVKKKKAYEVAI